VRGVARPESDHVVHERYPATVAREMGWRPVPGWFALFSVTMTTCELPRLRPADPWPAFRALAIGFRALSPSNNADQPRPTTVRAPPPALTGTPITHRERGEHSSVRRNGSGLANAYA
jgi:hypothetical protein